MTTQTPLSDVAQRASSDNSLPPLVDPPALYDAAAPASARSHKLPSHIPALDGIRGIAVLFVLWCHAVHSDLPVGSAIDRLAFTTARLGWSGVDMFFVLSGFLITGILYDAKEKDHFFRNFYARRTVRIFPLYYACLVLFLLVLPAIFGSQLPLAMQPSELKHSQVFYWLYISNYSQAIMDFVYNTPIHHILHVSWSLAIEEQFYLIWPTVVFFFGRKTLIRICAGMFIVSLLLRIGIWTAFSGGENNPWQLAYLFTPCRLDVLAAGAIIALVARGPGGVRCLVKPAILIGPVAGITLIGTIGLMAKLGYRGGLGQTPGYVMFGSSLFALFYGSILVWALNTSAASIPGRIFSNGILRTYGKYSYAVYLLHLPVMIFATRYIMAPDAFRIGNTWLPAALIYSLITFALSLGVALLSWNLLEKHCLKLKDYFPMEKKASTATAWQGKDVARAERQ